MELCGEIEERFAVTAATGALGPLLAKLTAFLGDEYKLQEGTRQDIASIKSRLEPVHDLLWRLWGREDLDVSCKDLIREARELSYDMEDNIDRFISPGLEPGAFIQQETIKEFMERVKGVSERCHEVQMTVEANISKRNKLITDPRARFLHKDASELVGMEEKKQQLIKLLQENEMVCIVGSAGMGKTALADLVYHTIEDQFQCRAFVSVHPSPNMIEILSTIRSQVTNGATSAGSVTEPADQENIIDDISMSLSGKRYLAIIDDIWHWEDWEVIRKVLPNNNLGCKIIMTTRIKSIAEKCEIEQGTHVFKQSFSYEDAERLSHTILTKCVEEDILEPNGKWLSSQIAYMCGTAARGSSCPLAVICLSSAWANIHLQCDYREWDTWNDWVSKVLLLDRFLSTASLKPLIQSLSLGFDDLPVELRTCLLYCSMYPCDYHQIERKWLVRKWIAEGFVLQEEVAQAYFDKLVSRELLQPVLEKKYRVDPMMLAFLVWKSKEDDFVACMQCNGPHPLHTKQLIRCLSFYCMDRYPHEDVSHIRSLAFHGHHSQLDDVSFNKFKNLRVLDFDSCGGLENRHLVDICGLFWLSYLGLNGCHQITELPREIWKLQNLRTMDIRMTKVRGLYWEVPNSLSVIAGSMDTARVHPNSLTVIAGSMDTAQEQNVVVGPACKNGIISSSEAKFREDILIVIFIHYFQGCEIVNVPIHRLAGRHLNIPEWVKQDLRYISALDIKLFKLWEDDLEFLKKMPNLQALELRLEVLPRELIAITGGGFSKLETFYFDSRLPRVTFQTGAMPVLKHLQFKFYTSTASLDYMGIMNLPSLKNVVFRCSEYYTSDSQGSSKTIEVVRKEAAEHPSEITIWVNEKPEVFGRSTKPEVFGSSTSWISQRYRIFHQRELLLHAAETRQTIRGRLLAAETRQEGDKSGTWPVVEQLEEYCSFLGE